MTCRPLPELAEYRASQRPPLSRAELAKRLKVSRATVTRWENGTRKPDKRFAPLISEMIGVPTLTLLGVAD